MIISGISAKGGLAEMVEIPAHPHFVACQFHPEFPQQAETCRTRSSHGFAQAAMKHRLIPEPHC